MEFGPATTVSPVWLVKLLRHELGTYRLDRQQKLRFKAEMEDHAARFSFVDALLTDMLDNREKTAAPPAPQDRIPVRR